MLLGGAAGPGRSGSSFEDPQPSQTPPSAGLRDLGAPFMPLAAGL